MSEVAGDCPVRKPIQEQDLAGFKYFRKILKLLGRLHEDACERDKAHNRVLHYDQHIALILLYLFNPVVSSLRALAQVSTLAKVQQKLGIPKTNLVSLSEANRLFDASLLQGIVQDLGRELRPLPRDPRLRDLQGIVTLVDSTLITALPKLVKLLWLDEQHKAIKLHTHFELLGSSARVHRGGRGQLQRLEGPGFPAPARAGVCDGSRLRLL
jgi:hypothetical protein